MLSWRLSGQAEGVALSVPPSPVSHEQGAGPVRNVEDVLV